MEWRIKLFRDKLDSLSTSDVYLFKGNNGKTRTVYGNFSKDIGFVMTSLLLLWTDFKQLSGVPLLLWTSKYQLGQFYKKTKRHTFSDSLNAWCISSWFSAWWFWFRFPMNKKAAIGRRYSVKTTVLKTFEYSQMRF